MKEGAVDPLYGWHFNAAGYLNSRQRMCYDACLYLLNMYSVTKH